MDDRIYKLDFTQQEVELIQGILMEGKMKIVLPLWNKIAQQVKEQQEKEDENKDKTD